MKTNHNWATDTRKYYQVALKSYLTNGYAKSETYARAVNAFLNWCKNNGTPLNIEKVVGEKTYSPRLRTFTKEELDIILNNTQPTRFKQFIQFAYYTGCRRGELTSMTSELIEQGFVIGKTGKRQIKISNQARAVLDINNLWTYKVDYVSHKFRKEMKRLGIKDCQFHDLRRTFGLNLIKKGIPIYEVSKLLGHKSVKTTESHYAPLLVEDIKDFEL